MTDTRCIRARRAAVLAVALIFGLCGGASLFAAGPTVTIQFWHAANGAPNLVEYFQAYEKTHPNVKINQTVYVDDDYKTQSRVALSAGTTPDVWYTNTGASLSQFVNAGGLMDITSIATAKGWTKIYDPEAIKMCSIDGKLYGLPWSNYTPWMVLWANKDFFQANKLKYPKTVDELIALAKPLRDMGQEPLVFYNKDGWTGAILFGEYVLQQVGAEFVTNVNTGKLKWTDSKEAKVALQTLAKMAKAGLFLSDYATSRQDTALLVWKDQRSPLLYNGTWFTQVTGTKFDFKVDTIVLPLLTPTSQPKAYQNWVDWTLGVCPSSKIKDAAAEFMAYASNEEYFTISGNFQGNLTPVPAANKKIEIPYFFKVPPIMDQLSKPKTPFFCWAFPLPVIEVLQTQIKLVLSGQVSADDALKAIEAEHAKNR
jgi:raffinose/stachyose/melibiose transport system substrate-binding protein